MDRDGTLQSRGCRRQQIEAVAAGRPVDLMRIALELGPVFRIEVRAQLGDAVGQFFDEQLHEVGQTFVLGQARVQQLGLWQRGIHTQP